VNSELPISATTANVDYQVSGDGTTVWNLYNPCGFFRQSGYPGDEPDCTYQAPVSEPGADATITKEVICSDCDVAAANVVGALVSYEGTDDAGFDHNGSGTTGANGSVVFAVPAGTYTITLESLPAGYDQSSVGETETVTVATGDNATVTDDISQATATKIIDTAVPGALVCVFAQGVDQDGKPIEPPTDVTAEDCMRGLVVDKDLVCPPGQGGDAACPYFPYAANVEAIDALYASDPNTVTCPDFTAAGLYQEDAQYAFDNQYPDAAGLDGDNDQIACEELAAGPLSREETDAEVAQRLGAVAVMVTDENGDATFAGLPAGCYYAIINAPGYDIAVEPFCLTPGQTEVNEVDLTDQGQVVEPGILTKRLLLGDFGFGAAFGDFSLTSDVIFCEADMVDLNGDGVITDDEALNCDNFVEDQAAVAHGGFDNFVGGSDYIFEFNAVVAPGDYVICSSAFVTGDFDLLTDTDGDGDPTNDVETVGYDFMCEATSDTQTVDGVATTGPITVYSGLETLVDNDFAALAGGQLDVYVNDDDTDAPIDLAPVCLYDASHVQIACTTTDATGYASFTGVVGGTYIVSVDTPDPTTWDDSADKTIEYVVSDDAANGGVDDTGSLGGTTADVIVSLDNVTIVAGAVD